MNTIDVVTAAGIGTKDMACVKVCPVNCFYDAGEMVVINPDECIGCNICIPECPVNAIFVIEEVPAEQTRYITMNRGFFTGKSAEELEKLRLTA
jgi:NAD-dependent dihydropyrimidine dehydrogenase PreA subunit